MWEVQFGTGREFMKSMYTDFYRRSGQGESVLDLAVALQETVKRMKTQTRVSRITGHLLCCMDHGFIRKRLSSEPCGLRV